MTPKVGGEKCLSIKYSDLSNHKEEIEMRDYSRMPKSGVMGWSGVTLYRLGDTWCSGSWSPRCIGEGSDKQPS